MAKAIARGAAPLFNWPGGKRRLASKIRSRFPVEFNRYIEPFAGGAAVFFDLLPESAILSDTCAELINAYRVVAKHPQRLLSRVNGMENSKDAYYRVRADVPGDSLDRAVRFVYLTSLSFNGIYRVNLAGEFNVPYNYKERKVIADRKKVAAASSALKKAKLYNADFRKVVEMARSGDLLYVDPPYTTAHNENGFVKYNSRLFSWEDQIDLSERLTHKASQGVHVVVSNAWHASIRDPYRSFEQEAIQRYSSISASGAGRGQILEGLFVK